MKRWRAGEARRSHPRGHVRDIQQYRFLGTSTSIEATATNVVHDASNRAGVKLLPNTLSDAYAS